MDSELQKHEEWIAICRAIRDENLFNVRRYLEKMSANTNYRKRTLLMNAAKHGKVDIMQYLLEKGASVDDQDMFGNTALIIAARNGHLEAVNLLLQHKANVNLINEDGWTAISAASYRFHNRIVDILKIYGGNIEVDHTWELIYKALNTEYKEEYKNINFNYINPFGYTVLTMASSDDNFLMVAKCIQFGANINFPNRKGWTPLTSAVRHGNEDIVKFLIQKGADVNMECFAGWTPMGTAARHGHFNLIYLLLQNGAKIDYETKDGWTPLCTAIKNREYSIVKYLIDNGADVNRESDNGGFTPMFTAVRHDTTSDIAYILIEKGANCDERHVELARRYVSKGNDLDLALDAHMTDSFIWRD